MVSSHELQKKQTQRLKADQWLSDPQNITQSPSG